MADQFSAPTGWRTSSRCGSGGACVEVAVGPVVGMRDSKHPDGPVLVFAADTWRAFVGDVRSGRFDTASAG